MKTKLISTLTGVIATGLVILNSCTTQKYSSGTDVPAISFDQLTYDFGKVQKGDMVSHEFRFSNTGTEKLIVSDVHPSCGCTAALLSLNQLLPGAHGVVTANFNSSNYLGPVTKTITVTSNDPFKRIVTLTLTGEIVSDIIISPVMLFIGSVKAGKSIPQTINFNIFNPSVKITSVAASEPYIRVSTISQSVSQGTINVKIMPDAPSGPFNAYITIVSTSRREPMFRVAVEGKIVGNVR